MTAPSVERVAEWLHRRDPGWYAMRKAVRAGVVMPAVFAFAFEVVGNAQVATFAAFGCFALLVFADFHGSQSGRLAGYAMLAVTGAVLITAGTLLSRPPWLAVVGMAVAGFAVLFAGVVSSATASAGRAALLTFILPVMLVGNASDVAPRLEGWALAIAASVPAALFVWPPRQHDELRRRTAAVCRALAEFLGALPDTSRPAGHLGGDTPGTDRFGDVHSSLVALREMFRATTFRPVGLSTGSRLLIPLVDDLDWLAAITAALEEPATPRRADMDDVRSVAAGVLLASAAVLEPTPALGLRSGCRALVGALDELQEHARALRRRALGALPMSAPSPGTGGAEAAASVTATGDYGAAQSWGRVAHVTELVGATVAAIGAADARSALAKLTGRHPDPQTMGAVSAAQTIAAAHLTRHSVWLHNSLRGAAGLATAVLVAEAISPQHRFWVVLGALSVLRSNALSTGSTVWRVLAGTIAGFVIGALLLLAIGTSPDALWPLLPVAVFLASVAPDAVSFLAGQAAFTVVVIVLFNIIDPVGWKIGLVRIEDVALGCAASLAVGLLFWPRGAGAALQQALGDGYETASDYLASSVDHVTSGGRTTLAGDAESKAALLRLDDALRQYLAERGAKAVPLASLTLLTSGVTRLRLSAAAIASLPDEDPELPAPPPAASARVVVEDGGALSSWYRRFAASLRRGGSGVAALGPTRSTTDRLVTGLQEEVAGGDELGKDPSVSVLLSSSGYLDDLEDLAPRLLAPAAKLRARRGWSGEQPDASRAR